MALPERLAPALALASSALAQDEGIEISAGQTIFSSGTHISIT